MLGISKEIQGIWCKELIVVAHLKPEWTMTRGLKQEASRASRIVPDSPAAPLHFCWLWKSCWKEKDKRELQQCRGGSKVGEWTHSGISGDQPATLPWDGQRITKQERKCSKHRLVVDFEKEVLQLVWDSRQKKTWDGCLLPTGDVFNPAWPGNAVKGITLQFCRPRMLPDIRVSRHTRTTGVKTILWYQEGRH